MGFVCPSEVRWWMISKVNRFFWEKWRKGRKNEKDIGDDEGNLPVCGNHSLGFAIAPPEFCIASGACALKGLR